MNLGHKYSSKSWLCSCGDEFQKNSKLTGPDKIVNCLPVVLPMKYFAHCVLPASTLPMSISPVVVCQSQFASVQFARQCFALCRQGTHWQSTTFFTLTGKLHTGKIRLAKHQQAKYIMGKILIGNVLVGKVLAGNTRWAKYLMGNATGRQSTIDPQNVSLRIR